MKIKEVTDYIESIAPLAYQESYDNAGYICGNAEAEVKAVLICLDSTEEVVDEALKTGANLIIAHHPIVFSGIKKITGKNYIERVLIKAIKNDITIYAAHTNLDNVFNGVNSKIAQKLGLVNSKILAPISGNLKKLITFCPQKQADQVRNALFEVGAGNIGNYDECSFNTLGTGTFRGGDNSNPFVGEKGKQHQEQEVKIEIIFPAHIQNKLINTLLKAHPYEEVAYDIIPLDNTNHLTGAGLIGELAQEMDEMSFLKHIKVQMQANGIRYTKLLGKKVKKVAVCGGSGSFLLKNAINAGADIFITADFKYHQFFDAENRIIIADIGHFESEQYTNELFYEILSKKITTFAVHLSKINTNPINYL